MGDGDDDDILRIQNGQNKLLVGLHKVHRKYEGVVF